MALNENSHIYRVVRYIDQPPMGRVRDVMALHLTYDEAKRMAFENTPVVESEEVVIEREDLDGADSEVFEVHSSD